MKHHSDADPSDAGTPVSVEAAFRRVRLLVGALVLVRLWSADSLPHLEALALVGAFWSINLISYIAERQNARTPHPARRRPDCSPTPSSCSSSSGPSTRTRAADSADWAVLVLPVIEGAIRFQSPGRDRELARARRRATRLEHGDVAEPARRDDRAAAHRRVPRRAAGRIPRRAARRRDRRAPRADARRPNDAARSCAPAALGGQRTSQARRRRDPRRAPRHGRGDGLRRAAGVRALRPMPPRRPAGRTESRGPRRRSALRRRPSGRRPADRGRPRHGRDRRSRSRAPTTTRRRRCSRCRSRRSTTRSSW